MEWRRSSIGITPLTIRPRAGRTHVKKLNVRGAPVSSGAPARDVSPAPGVQGKPETYNSSKVEIIVPLRGGEAGADGLAPPSSSSSRQLTAVGAGGTRRVCSVCTRASADYSCPRCLIGYCSSNCYKTHGSSCTEAFFRGHVERETRLREGEEIEQGSGGTGPKEERRANMVELLRRIRRGEREGDTSGTRGGTGSTGPGSEEGSGFGAVDASREDEELQDRMDGELDVQQERLEALALALKEGVHPLRTQVAQAAPPATAAAVNPSADGVARDSEAGRVSSSSSSGARVEHAPHRGHGEQQVFDDDGEGMLDLLTPEERRRFLREVASGRLGKLIVPWVPWWMQSARVQEVTSMTAGGRTSHSLPPPVVNPCHRYQDSAACSTEPRDADGDCQASSPPTCPPTPEQQQRQHERSTVEAAGGKSGGGGGGDGDSIGGGVKKVTTGTGREETKAATAKSTVAASDADDSCTRHSFAALLSQAFRAPDFSTICAKEPSPTLPALATDLAYAYVLTSRLYNGCWCSDPVGASHSLVGASPVLRDGATPDTVVQALTACVERAVEGEAAGFRDYAESLRQDVLQVCSDPRKLVCAFQDAWVMLEAAGRTLAPSITNSSFRPVSGKGKKAQRRAAKELGKVEKRIGYFLLWARSHGEEAAPQMMKAVEGVVSEAALQQKQQRQGAIKIAP